MHKNWLNRNYKWSVPFVTLTIIIIYLLTSSGLGKISTDLAQAYADKELFENAIEKANTNKQVLKIIGEIQPIDKMTILNGETRYSENNERVISTIKVQGDQGQAKLDLTAHRIKEKWKYEEINIRITHPSENAQTIKILELER